MDDPHDHDYFHFLADLTDAVMAVRDIPHLASETAEYLHAFFGLDYISIEIYDPEAFRLDTHSITYDRQNHRSYSNISKSLHTSTLGKALQNHETILFNRQAMVENTGKYPFIDALLQQGLQVLLHIPLIANGILLGSLAIGSFRHSRFSPDIMELLSRVALRLSSALDVIQTRRDHDFHGHGIALTDESVITGNDQSNALHDVIGDSPAIHAILKQIEIVASSNATVLLQGETGTGKGLVAQTIHNISDRRDHEMIKMNCTAIPSELMESELFGHEKGAFTGAMNRRIGHFELADKSTLFLDEIGDMPIDLQPKLLSVLQEHQIRRLGSTGVIPVDVRCIAATNCNLARKVEDKTFRSDLFYRLNVFPITIPPLRERAGDIPLLAKFFVRKYATQMKRHITTIPRETLAMMTRLPWPGNIRELENVMERAVILTGDSPVLNLTPETLLNFTTESMPSAICVTEPPATATPSVPALSAAPIPPTDREAIVTALRATGGQIGGKSGAAAMLGLKRTTLLARIKKLGIDADAFREKPETASGND